MWHGCVQVPYRLGVACCSVLSNKQQCDTLFTTGLQESTKDAMSLGAVVLRFLERLLLWASNGRVMDIPMATQGSTSMQQQLLDSGVVQLLPELLTRAADSLQPFVSQYGRPN
jgi:hypothetical protein